MAKGVKKIKRLSNSYELDNYYNAGEVICINPNQEASFLVGEWYSETTEEEKRRNVSWLWMDQKKRKIFNQTMKPAGVPYGVTIPRKLCGLYAFYLEVGLYGRHDERNTGLYVFSKCEKKITSSSWSKKENTADNSEINYGHDLFISLEAEGVNGETLTLELYSEKKITRIEKAKEKCIDGALKTKFKTMACYRGVQGLPSDLEKFHIKVLDSKGEYLKNASGNDKIISFTIKNKSLIQIPVFEPPTNTTPFTIDNTPKEEEIKTEGIITAYFAKEEFSLETAEVADQFEYKFKNRNANIDKDKIAAIIKKNVDPQVKADKKYAKLDDIKNALTERTYEKGASISFNLYKLGANYIKINSAPLEEEVYVVAKTFLLDGKEVSITIKEKETILIDADANVPVLEAKEDGAELATLKATVEKGIAKVKIKLRPKADEDLKEWKEKLLKGKKEEAYRYTFKNETVITDSNKKQFAVIILNNAKEGKQGNAKIATGKTAFADDVEKALKSETYSSGATISFDTYKTQAESLWLKAECQGETVKHEKEFLKRDGAYFIIGKKCECEARIRAFMRVIRIAEGTGEYIKGTKQARDPELGYTTWFSGAGNNFTLSDDHPRVINSNSTNTIRSSAAGAYQIMSWKYDNLNGYTLVFKDGYFQKKLPEEYIEKYDKAKKYDAKGFSKEAQDKLCVAILKDDAKVINALQKKDIKEAISKSSGIWVSLPGATAGQPTAKMQETLDYYEEFLKDELAGKSNLHIKQGFLKDFDIKCSCDLGDCTEEKCTQYADVVPNPQISTDNGGKKNNRFNSAGGRKNPHRGVDIYTGDNKVDVHSLLCGEVVFTVTSFATNEYNSTSLGNLVVVKSKDKNDEVVYIMYCHLDSVKVAKNDKVKHNDVIGISGSTGNAGSVYENGKLIHGISPENYHIHIEASTSYVAGTATFKNVASSRVNPEDYMKTKFDIDGEKI
ncbi:peptidoglycan DD-metalloendopeptidase family protein [Flavobacterium chungangensis]|uniref:Peptidoglycan DD-metalloendopeptidase family protein n=1 Tax=Flavobacterium chungangensis TaxID=2708132 RepID=A0ABV8ZEV8_9FLAO